MEEPRTNHHLIQNSILEIQKTIGENMRKYRSVAKLTQVGLVSIANISLTNYRKIEDGMGNPTVQTLEQIAKALNVPLENFICPPDNEFQEIQYFFQLIAKTPVAKIEPFIDILNNMTDIMNKFNKSKSLFKSKTERNFFENESGAL